LIVLTGFMAPGPRPLRWRLPARCRLHETRHRRHDNQRKRSL